MAKVDEDGYFFIVDRKKDLIIRGGYNVYPREIEEVLYEHPAVQEAAVIGVPHDELGEEVGAAVVLKEGEDADADAIKRVRQGRGGRLQVPAPGVVHGRAAEGPDGQDPQARDRGAGQRRRLTAQPNPITLRMPSWASISSKPLFTSSRVSSWEISGSTSMLALQVAVDELRAPGRGP